MTGIEMVSNGLVCVKVCRVVWARGKLFFFSYEGQ